MGRQIDGRRNVMVSAASELGKLSTIKDRGQTDRVTTTIRPRHRPLTLTFNPRGARIVLLQPSLSSRDTFQLLHWLPFKWRSQFQLAPLTYKVLHTDTLSSLSERLHS